MLLFLFQCFIEAAALMFLLKAINDDDISLGIAFFVALVAAIGTTILAVVLTVVLGIAGLFLAVVLGAALLGVAVSALFGVEIKRSFLVGGVFMILHIAISFGFQAMVS